MAQVQLAPDPAPELVELARELLSGVDDFTELVVEQIRLRVPYYGGPEHLALGDTNRWVGANVESVLRSFVFEGPPDVAAARATGRERGEQGVPLPIVMAAYRVGFHEIWTRLLERARSGGVTSDALVEAASQIWSAHDTFSQAMADGYRHAVFGEMLRTEQERSALVGVLLEGRISDELTSWDAADLLRLPGQGPFVVVAAEVAELAKEAVPGAETRLRLSGMSSAWRLLPDLHVGIVRLTDEAQVHRLSDELAKTARGRVGISPAYPRLNDTAVALRLARMALATAAPGEVQVRVFDEHPLGVAAVNASAAMDRIVRTVLGPVLDLPGEDRAVLLSTLAAWRDNGGSTESTSKQLFCHPNTVRLRLRRLEGLTGRLLGDPRAAAETLLALESVEANPPLPDGV
ncbi:PucR family transcriptional regulator [Microlunatus flavus]|uniref:PucR C-terminal helix-turn-helix domain-containing protein n=1 Tax=Microlunatus flavus TaxID=1036181 RepID=A0A1H9FSG5_9ACTN|nr:helix-turn-helix domain-containing protein [Microlunatus flavus]SEQ40882.1 PucR C-terminal helix-turn-helix domain-containing protein [Microlunatus flavus]